MAETLPQQFDFHTGQHLETCPARPVEIDSPDKLQKDYDIVCPNSFMGCSCTFPLSQLRGPFADLYVFRHVARVRKVATDGRATPSAAKCRAGAGATVAGRERDCAGAAAARVARKKGLAPQAEVTIQTAKLVTDEVQNTGLRRLGAELRETAAAAAAAAARGNARRAAIQVIAAVAQRAFSSTNCEAKVFGSCAYGLDAASSDVDLVITNWCDGELIEDRPYVAYVLLRFAQHLRAEPSVVVDRVLDRARVPVIRATIYVDDGSVPVDVSLECASHTDSLLPNLGRSLVDEVSQLAPAAVAVRALLRKAGLNDAYTGGLPSYAVLLMLYYATLNGDEQRGNQIYARKKPVDALADASRWVAWPRPPSIIVESDAHDTAPQEVRRPPNALDGLTSTCEKRNPHKRRRRRRAAERAARIYRSRGREAAPGERACASQGRRRRVGDDVAQLSSACLEGRARSRSRCATAGGAWPTATRWAVCSSKIRWRCRTTTRGRL